MADEQSCALYTSGIVECWGADTRRALGMRGDPEAPLQIPGIAHAVTITVGDDYGCALDEEGPLCCWGYCDLSCRAGRTKPIF